MHIERNTKVKKEDSTGVTMINSASQKIIIVGGVAGGATAAARLRRLDEQAEIILCERGEYVSFANCGLPYYIGDTISERSKLILQTSQSFYNRFRIDVRVKHEVISINRYSQTVTIKNLANGETYLESYDKLILSTGALPINPIQEMNYIRESAVAKTPEKYFSLRNIPDSDRIKDHIDTYRPNSAIIVGAGLIGLEMAENLHKILIDVTLIDSADQVLPQLDIELASEVKTYLEKNRVEIELGCSIKKMVDKGIHLEITLSNGRVLETEMLLFAVGVRPDTYLAKNAELALNERGYIQVSEHMLTTDPNIYAVGDAVEITNFITKQPDWIPLASPANKQGRIAADNICGINSRYGGTQGSTILKVFDLTIAATGIHERTAKRLEIDYEKIFTYSDSHASYYPGASKISIKTLFNPKTGKILGAQMIGKDGVDKRCDVLATALRFGATAKDLIELELCYAPPFSSAKDPINMIGYAIENVLTKRVRNIHWHDVADLPRDNSVIFLDTRTMDEFLNSHIAGFINIPLDELRERLDELDSSKTIYVTCQVGLRGYIATRILMQNGFDAYNLNGGFRLWKSIIG